MKIDTKYAPNIIDRLNSSTAGALANILDRMIYDMNPYGEHGCIHMPRKVYVGKDGKLAYVAPWEGKKGEYADGANVLVMARDELYAMALKNL